MGLDARSVHVKNAVIIFDIDGRDVEAKVSRFQVTFQANGIPSLVAWASNIKLDRKLARDTRLQLKLEIGKVYASDSDLRDAMPQENSELVLFTGRLKDVGPGEAQIGNVSLQILAQGNLGALHCGSIRFNRFMPRSRNDMTFEQSFGSSVQVAAYLDEEVWRARPLQAYIDALAGVITDEPVVEDLSQLNIALREKFGELNIKALEVLDGMKDLSQLGPAESAFSKLITDLSEEDDPNGLIGTLHEATGQQLLSDFTQDTFLTKLLRFCEAFQCGLVETGAGHAIVPVTSFVPTEVCERNVIGANDYHHISRLEGPVRPVAGTVLVTDQGTDFGQPTNKQPGVYGGWVRPAGTLGHINIVELPNMLSLQQVSVANGFGDAIYGAVAPQTGTVAKPEEGESREDFLERTAEEEASVALATSLAKFMTWNTTWAATSVDVTCGFLRTDIAPLTPVKVEISDKFLNETQTTRTGIVNNLFSGPSFGQANAEAPFGPAIYGMVESVSIAMDATNGQCSTSFRVRAIRTTGEQAEIDATLEVGEHSMFAGAWGGMRLDEKDFSRFIR